VLNPDFGLLYAHLEAAQVAELLHTASRIGSEATSVALWAAAGDAVLHVAGHTVSDANEATIKLWDRDVTALEIAARAQAPSLAVLSSCSSATSSANNVELVDSLATGFLAAGSQHVVATLRSIDDASARVVMLAFYGRGDVSDPARALHAAQSALWKTKNVAWPIFTVFGPDVCPSESELP
jgi:CHAT domain-containing protein